MKTKQFRTLAILAIMSFFSATIFANTTIRGRVLDSSNQPVEYATATILSPDSETIIEGDMCNDNGDFIIENVKPGEYILSVRQVGFDKDETRKIVVNEQYGVVDVNTVYLNEANNELKEIEVVGSAVKGAAGKKNS